MSVKKVREYLKEFHKDQDIQVLSESSATVELAAKAVGVEPARIAKTLSFCGKEEGTCVLVVTAGDQKVDNSKFKHFFGMKAKMPKGDEVEKLTGHAPGGVCPFANPPHTAVYLDTSMKRFDTVFPAAGSGNSAVEMTCDELFACSGAREWVDVCKPIQ